MNQIRTLAEQRMHDWQQYIEQLAARRQKLAQEMAQIDVLTQQHIGAISGMRELMDMLPPDEEPGPGPEPSVPPAEA